MIAMSEFWRDRLEAVDTVRRWGHVRNIHATYLEADGPNVPIGTLCSIEASDRSNRYSITAEVVRVSEGDIALVPLDDRLTTFSGARVDALPTSGRVPVGPSLLGRAVDALGRPIDGEKLAQSGDYGELTGRIVPMLDRTSPSKVFESGIRAIDALLTLGKGQRVGLFAASGVGKTSLMTQIATQAEADVVILCLVGERGREVEALWNSHLSEAKRNRSTLVAATSDESAPMRARACHYALALAEYWRDRGKHVLLVLDSITRLAMALREIGLAAGEPPVMRGYTPSVFATLPKIVERCGALKSGGATTAIMTVLSETDDNDDPICETMKALLDGHIILSRKLAEKGHFPAIDVLKSVSRNAEAITDSARMEQSQKILEWLSALDESSTLIDAGLYSKGHNIVTDKAIERRTAIEGFLKQKRSDQSSFEATSLGLSRLVSG